MGGCHFDVTGLEGVDLPVTLDDLATNDQATPDLAMSSDLSGIDLRGVDLSQPDLAKPDLSMPDLSLLSDLAKPVDLTPPTDLADPCLPAPTLPANSIAAHCSVGDIITIDGNLADWTTTFFTNTVTHANAADHGANNTWTNNEGNNDKDLSADFAVRWDANALYVAAHITDDSTINFTSANNDQIWKGDSIEVYVRSGTSGGAYTNNDFQLIFDVSNESRMFRTGSNAGDIPTGVQFAAVIPSASWTFEVKIPWSAIGGAGSLGRNLGLDIAVNDCDGNMTNCRNRYLIWKVQPVATCTGCATGCSVTCNTAGFYGLQLGAR